MKATTILIRLNPTFLRTRAAKAVRRSRRPRFETLEDRAVPSTFLVNNLGDSGDGSLRQAVLNADANPGADVIAFAPRLSGKINLTSGEIDITDAVSIHGLGSNQVTVRAGGRSRVFGVFGTSAALDGLTIANGAADSGGGILNVGGSLDLDHMLFVGNLASADNAVGGAVFSTGAGASLSVEHSGFLGNQARGAVLAAGGAIADDSGVGLTVSDSTFVGNVASGGGFASVGGAISNGVSDGGGPATVSGSMFLANQATGGDGTPDTGFIGGIGAGGAIFNDLLGAATVAGSFFGANVAQGGAGAQANVEVNTSEGGFGFGGAIESGNPFAPFPTALNISQSDFVGNQAVGGRALEGEGGNGGSGMGGAINCASIVPGASAVIDQCRFTANEGVGARGADGVNGGNGGQGGTGEAGAIRVSGDLGGVDNFDLSITATVFRNNAAVSGDGGDADGAGNGGSGGSGFAGTLEIDDNSTLSISHTQIYDSISLGGKGGKGGPLSGNGGSGGAGIGGAIDSDPTPSITADHLVIERCTALGGAGGPATGTGLGGAGGDAVGGAIDLIFLDNNGNILLRDCSLRDNRAVAGIGGAGLGTGTGGNGGNAKGGALYIDPRESAVVLDTVFTDNSAIGGNGGAGATNAADGQGLGGAIFNSGSLTINQGTKFHDNFASTADDDISGPFNVI
jgi:hypothetical protein